MKQLIFFSALALFAAAQLNGCANKDEASPPHTNFIPQEPLLPIQKTLSLAKTWCSDSAECPESVGYVLVTVAQGPVTGVIQCTGFLVAPDIVATNSHCIPKDLRPAGSDCADLIGIAFPESGKKPEESFVCQTILQASKIAEHDEDGFLKNADYAFFKLTNPTKRKAMNLSRRGFPDGETLTLFTMTPRSEKKPEGELSRKRCRLVKGTSFMPEDVSAYSEVAVAFGEKCDATQGNSGSPVIGSNGRVVGLLHGGISPEIDLNAVVPPEDHSEPLERPVYLTNLACMEFAPEVPAITGSMPSACDPKARSEISMRAADLRKEKILHEVTAALIVNYTNWLKTAPPIFAYQPVIKLKDADNTWTGTFDPAPKCVRPRSQWTVEGEPAKWTEERVPAFDSLRSELIIVTELLVPHYQQVPHYDRYSRPTMKMKAFAHRKLQIEFDWNQLSEASEIIGATILANDESDSNRQPLRLRACTSADLASGEPVQITGP